MDAERAKLAEAEAAFMEKETAKLQKRFQQEKARLHVQFVAERTAEYGAAEIASSCGKEPAYVSCRAASLRGSGILQCHTHGSL